MSGAASVRNCSTMAARNRTELMFQEAIFTRPDVAAGRAGDKITRPWDSSPARGGMRGGRQPKKGKALAPGAWSEGRPSVRHAGGMRALIRATGGNLEGPSTATP